MMNKSNTSAPAPRCPELSHRVAAIAPVVATIFGDEKQPTHPVSALMMNGVLDKNVPLTGGKPQGRGSRSWDGTPMQPIERQAEYWAAANRCDTKAEKKESDNVIHFNYRCPSSRAVELVLVKDNGHAWSGGKPGSRRGDKPSASISATDLIWNFFKAHPKEAASSR